MKKLVLLIGLIVVAILGLVNREILASSAKSIMYQTPCANPRTYSIGTIDSRFGMSEEAVIQAAQQAGSIWKNADGKVLLQYDPEAKLTINLVYDQRQSLNTEVNQLNTQIEEQKNTLKPDIAAYQDRAEAFKKRNNELNTKVAYWNNQGGAPEEEYNKLVAEQKELRTEAQELQTMAIKLNQSTDIYNSQVQNLDQRVSEFNETLREEPEEGEYIKSGRDEKIIIYIVNSNQELVHTLAHEMGHALNVPHNNTPLSIMYPKTNKNTTLSTEDLTSLIEVCRQRSIFETAGNKFAILAQEVQLFTKQALSNTQEQTN